MRSERTVRASYSGLTPQQHGIIYRALQLICRQGRALDVRDGQMADNVMVRTPFR